MGINIQILGDKLRRKEDYRKFIANEKGSQEYWKVLGRGLVDCNVTQLKLSGPHPSPYGNK